MLIVIRADASVEIGAGHISRCLTLADVWRGRGAEVRFICLDLPGNLSGYVAARGFTVHRLAYGASFREESDLPATQAELLSLGRLPDWLIVDHYGISERSERVLRGYCDKLLAIDDVARAHCCDLLLDQNYYRDPDSRYEGKLCTDEREDDEADRQSRLLLGPGYALIHSAFAAQGLARSQRGSAVRRVLVFFGGSDEGNMTTRVLRALDLPAFRRLHLDVVVGSGNPQRDQVRRLCARRPHTSFHCQINYMDRLMGRADLAIGAGGTTTWERLAAGLPAIVIAIADNQVTGARELASARAIDYLGTQDMVTATAIRAAVLRAMSGSARLRGMRDRGFRLMELDRDSAGSAERVVERMLGVI